MRLIFSILLVVNLIPGLSMAQKASCLPQGESVIGFSARFFPYTIRDQKAINSLDYISGGYLSDVPIGSSAGITNPNFVINPCVFGKSTRVCEPPKVFEMKSNNKYYCGSKKCRNSRKESVDGIKLYGVSTTATNVTVELTGYLYVKVTGVYTFAIKGADDAASISVGGGVAFDCCDQDSLNSTHDTSLDVNGIKPWQKDPTPVTASVYLFEDNYYPVKLMYVNIQNVASLETTLTLPDGEVVSDWGRMIQSFGNNTAGDTSNCTLAIPDVPSFSNVPSSTLQSSLLSMTSEESLYTQSDSMTDESYITESDMESSTVFDILSSSVSQDTPTSPSSYQTSTSSFAGTSSADRDSNTEITGISSSTAISLSNDISEVSKTKSSFHSANTSVYLSSTVSVSYQSSTPPSRSAEDTSTLQNSSTESSNQLSSTDSNNTPTLTQSVQWSTSHSSPESSAYNISTLISTASTRDTDLSSHSSEHSDLSSLHSPITSYISKTSMILSTSPSYTSSSILISGNWSSVSFPILSSIFSSTSLEKTSTSSANEEIPSPTSSYSLYSTAKSTLSPSSDSAIVTSRFSSSSLVTSTFSAQLNMSTISRSTTFVFTPIFSVTPTFSFANNGSYTEDDQYEIVTPSLTIRNSSAMSTSEMSTSFSKSSVTSSYLSRSSVSTETLSGESNRSTALPMTSSNSKSSTLSMITSEPIVTILSSSEGNSVSMNDASSYGNSSVIFSTRSIDTTAELSTVNSDVQTINQTSQSNSLTSLSTRTSEISTTMIFTEPENTHSSSMISQYESSKETLSSSKETSGPLFSTTRDGSSSISKNSGFESQQSSEYLTEMSSSVTNAPTLSEGHDTVTGRSTSGIYTDPVISTFELSAPSLSESNTTIPVSESYLPTEDSSSIVVSSIASIISSSNVPNINVSTTWESTIIPTITIISTQSNHATSHVLSSKVTDASDGDHGIISDHTDATPISSDDLTSGDITIHYTSSASSGDADLPDSTLTTSTSFIEPTFNNKQSSSQTTTASFSITTSDVYEDETTEIHEWTSSSLKPISTIYANSSSTSDITNYLTTNTDDVTQMLTSEDTEFLYPSSTLHSESIHTPWTLPDETYSTHERTTSVEIQISETGEDTSTQAGVTSSVDRITTYITTTTSSLELETPGHSSPVSNEVDNSEVIGSSPNDSSFVNGLPTDTYYSSGIVTVPKNTERSSNYDGSLTYSEGKDRNTIIQPSMSTTRGEQIHMTESVAGTPSETSNNSGNDDYGKDHKSVRTSTNSIVQVTLQSRESDEPSTVGALDEDIRNQQSLAPNKSPGRSERTGNSVAHSNTWLGEQVAHTDSGRAHQTGQPAHDFPDLFVSTPAPEITNAVKESTLYSSRRQSTMDAAGNRPPLSASFGSAYVPTTSQFLVIIALVCQIL